MSKKSTKVVRALGKMMKSSPLYEGRDKTPKSNDKKPGKVYNSGQRQSDSIEDVRNPQKAEAYNAKTKLFTRFLDGSDSDNFSPLKKGIRIIKKTPMVKQGGLDGKTKKVNEAYAKARSIGLNTNHQLAAESYPPQKKFEKTKFFKHKIEKKK